MGKSKLFSFELEVNELLVLGSMMSIILFPFLTLCLPNDEIDMNQSFAEEKKSLTDKNYLRHIPGEGWIVEKILYYLVSWLASPSSIVLGINQEDPETRHILHFSKNEELLIEIVHHKLICTLLEDAQEFPVLFMQKLGFKNPSELANYKCFGKIEIIKYEYENNIEIHRAECQIEITEGYISKLMFLNNGQNKDMDITEPSNPLLAVEKWIFKAFCDAD